MKVSGASAVVIGGGSGVGRGIALGLGLAASASLLRTSTKRVRTRCATKSCPQVVRRPRAPSTAPNGTRLRARVDGGRRLRGRRHPVQQRRHSRQQPSRRGVGTGLGVGARAECHVTRAGRRRLPAVSSCGSFSGAHRAHRIDGGGLCASAHRRGAARHLHGDEARCAGLRRDVAQRARARVDRRVGPVPWNGAVEPRRDVGAPPSRTARWAVRSCDPVDGRRSAAAPGDDAARSRRADRRTRYRGRTRTSSRTPTPSTWSSGVTPRSSTTSTSSPNPTERTSFLGG